MEKIIRTCLTNYLLSEKNYFLNNFFFFSMNDLHLVAEARVTKSLAV